MITIPKDNGKIMPLSEKDKAVIEAVSMYVNYGGVNPLKAGGELAEIHRALHGTLFKLFIGWCREMAVNHYKGHFDTRNRAVSRKVADLYDYMIEQNIVEDPDYLSDTMMK